MKKESNTEQQQQQQQQNHQQSPQTREENTTAAADLLEVAATQEKNGTNEDPGSNVSIRLSSGNHSRQKSRSGAISSSRVVKEYDAIDGRIENNNNTNAEKVIKRINEPKTATTARTPPKKKQVGAGGGAGAGADGKAAGKGGGGGGRQPKKKYGRRGPPLLQPNTKIGAKYTIIQMFAGGGFGQVYRAFDEDRQITVAVKVEPKDHDPGRIILEQNILSQLKGTPNAPTLYASGTIGNNNYLVMEILGPNLSDIRKKFKNQCLSLGSALRTTLQASTALRTLHGIGYVHRDVKPSNFCIGFSGAQRRIIYLVDFGLSRQFRDAKGRLRRKRRVAAFRGTLKYVSINVHAKKEQGPVDDFISLFYTGFELAEGSLPWRSQKDVLMVEQMKRNFKYEEHVKRLPATFKQFYEHLEPLTYKSHLNYEYLQQIIKVSFFGAQKLLLMIEPKNQAYVGKLVGGIFELLKMPDFQNSLPDNINDKTLYDWEESGGSVDAGTMVD